MEYFNSLLTQYGWLLRVAGTVVLLLIAVFGGAAIGRGIHVLSQKANLPPATLLPLRLLTRYGIVILMVFALLTVWGMDVGSILASLAATLALVAIGLVALWSILSNFLCTFVLILFKPFAVGDELEFPTEANIKGKVVDLNLVFTVLETPEGSQYQIPNNMFFQRMYKRTPARAGKSVQLEEQLAQTKPAGPQETNPRNVQP